MGKMGSVCNSLTEGGKGIQLVALLLGSAPLPAAGMLRPLPPLPRGSVLLIVAAPHQPMNQPRFSAFGKASRLRTRDGNYDTNAE